LRLREVDTVARLGGDEFVILLEDVKTVESVGVVAQAIIDAANLPFHLDGGMVAQIGASIGISIYPMAARDADRLLTSADNALYQAKASGRGLYKMHDPAAADRPAPAIA